MRARLAVGVLVAVGCGGGKGKPAAGTGVDAAVAVGGGSGSAGAKVGSGGSTGSGAKVAAAAAATPEPAFERPGPADAVVDLWGECATRASGHVDCWDSADSHVQRVDGVEDALAMREPPVKNSADLCLIRRTGVDCGSHKFPGITDAVDIVGRAPQCVLRKNGVVVCRSDDHPKPGPVPKLTDAVSLATNGLVTCALRASGAVMCAPAGDPWRWRPVKGLAKVRALGLTHLANDTSVACAATADGELRCYDLGGRGSVATLRPERKDRALDRSAFHGASTIVMAQETDSPQPTALVAGHVIVCDGERTRTLPLLADAIAITGHCALRVQGSVVCWDDDAPTAVPL